MSEEGLLSTGTLGDFFKRNKARGLLSSETPLPTGLLGAFVERPQANPIREKLYPGEDAYFRQNPSVAGMAADDDRVILNPYSTLGPAEKRAVALNELARIAMRRQPTLGPTFSLTPEQEAMLAGTTYANAAPQERAATVAARILSQDPSAGQPTREQMEFVAKLRRAMGL